MHILAYRSAFSGSFGSHRTAIGISDWGFRAGMRVLLDSGVIVNRKQSGRGYATEELVEGSGRFIELYAADLDLPTTVLAFVMVTLASPVPLLAADVAKRIGVTSPTTVRGLAAAAAAAGRIELTRGERDAIVVARKNGLNGKLVAGNPAKFQRDDLAKNQRTKSQHAKSQHAKFQHAHVRWKEDTFDGRASRQMHVSQIAPLNPPTRGETLPACYVRDGEIIEPSVGEGIAHVLEAVAIFNAFMRDHRLPEVVNPGSYLREVTAILAEFGIAGWRTAVENLTRSPSLRGVDKHITLTKFVRRKTFRAILNGETMLETRMERMGRICAKLDRESAAARGAAAPADDELRAPHTAARPVLAADDVPAARCLTPQSTALPEETNIERTTRHVAKARAEQNRVLPASGRASLAGPPACDGPMGLGELLGGVFAMAAEHAARNGGPESAAPAPSARMRQMAE